MITVSTKKMELGNFGKPVEVRTFEKGKVEILNIGGGVVGRAILQPGWKWSTCVKPIAKTKSCESAHLQYQISGRMMVVMDDGTQKEIGPGDVSYVPSGHDAWVVGNEPVVAVDFNGMTQYAK